MKACEVIDEEEEGEGEEKKGQSFLLRRRLIVKIMMEKVGGGVMRGILKEHGISRLEEMNSKTMKLVLLEWDVAMKAKERAKVKRMAKG